MTRIRFKGSFGDQPKISACSGRPPTHWDFKKTPTKAQQKRFNDLCKISASRNILSTGSVTFLRLMYQLFFDWWSVRLIPSPSLTFKIYTQTMQWIHLRQISFSRTSTFYASRSTSVRSSEVKEGETLTIQRSLHLVPMVASQTVCRKQLLRHDVLQYYLHTKP